MHTQLKGAMHKMLRAAFVTEQKRDVFAAHLKTIRPSNHAKDKNGRNFCNHFGTNESRGGDEERGKVDKKVRIDSSGYNVTFLNDKHLTFKRNLN